MRTLISRKRYGPIILLVSLFLIGSMMIPAPGAAVPIYQVTVYGLAGLPGISSPEEFRFIIQFDPMAGHSSGSVLPGPFETVTNYNNLGKYVYGGSDTGWLYILEGYDWDEVAYKYTSFLELYIGGWNAGEVYVDHATVTTPTEYEEKFTGLSVKVIPPVPLSGAALLLGTGLIPLAWFRRRSRLGK